VKIEYAKIAYKFINEQNSKTKKRIREAVYGLTEKPPRGDIKTLQGYSDGRKRLRKGEFRIIFKFLLDKSEKEPNEILYIMDIGVRGNIYK